MIRSLNHSQQWPLSGGSVALCVAVLVGASLSGVATANAEPEAIAGLSADEREVFTKVANQALCPCNCPLTLSGCLKDKPKCKRAAILSRFVARQAQAGLTTMDIMTAVAEGFTGSLAGKPAALAKPPAYSLKGQAGGKAGAKITIVEYADFRCSHCREAAKFVDALVAALGDRVEVSFRHFPIGANEPSVLAAEAAEAAGAQGKFWQMHELLFKYPEFVLRDDLIKYAGQLKLDVARFTKELDEHKHRAKVLADKEEGTKAGVDGTPAFFMNGRMVKLDRSIDTWRDRIDYELSTQTQCNE